MKLREVLNCASQIADALEAAHAKGIVHRDLKPAKVEINADGTVNALDFGLENNASAESRGSGRLANFFRRNRAALPRGSCSGVRN